MDDGLDPFGSNREPRRPLDFDTPEWRAEMRERYGDGGSNGIEGDGGGGG